MNSSPEYSMISVANIERFATHDGPGIRTVVFLKGCPLRCPWCANRETWSLKPLVMHDERKCVKCGCCAALCPQKAISFTPEFQLNYDECTNCFKCVDECLNDALSVSGRYLSIEEIIKEIKKDDAYYRNSQGGVTLSGGEPLYQGAKSLELLISLKAAGYHTALETTGNYRLELLKEAEPYVDLFLFDLKHCDAQKLKEVTGGDLQLILHNLKYLSEKCPEKVIVRVPVIPGFNYDEETIHGIIQLVKELNLSEIDLLPFHNLGKDKWHKLQAAYDYEDEKMLAAEELKKYKEYIEKMGMIAKIGG